MPDRKIDFMDPATSECPYPSYDVLRAEEPVYFDERTQMFVLTRFDDVREVLRDAKRFVVGNRRPVPKWELIEKVFLEKGWVPGPSLGGLDNPQHKELRNLYNDAFSMSRINALEPFVTDLAHRLIDDLAGQASIEFVEAFAVPFPLHVIGHIVGVENDEDLWRIKGWTDAWIGRRGMMQSDEELVASTELQVEGQHFFQKVIDRLRLEDDGTLLAHIVRTEIPEWGRPLNDSELHTATLQEMFVAGFETTTSPLGHGMKMLLEDADLLARVRKDRDLVPAFCEEVLRIESPVQGLFRITTEDVELHGVTIPAGSMINARYGAANRDGEHFECPADVRLERDNGTRHLAFGQGTHVCMGAPLARLELRVGFNALLDRLEDLAFVPEANDFRHKPNFVVRGLKELHLTATVTPREGSPSGAT